MIKGFPKWEKAKMFRFVLLNIHGRVSWHSSTNSSRQFIPMRRRNIIIVDVLWWRTASTSTIPSAINITVGFSSSTASSVTPITLPWLSLIKYLWHHKFTFFLFFMLPQMVLMHYPVCLLRFTVLPKVCVENKNFLTTSLLPIHHYWPSLTCLVPTGFTSLQVLTFCLDLPSFSCTCCVCFWWSVEEMST